MKKFRGDSFLRRITSSNYTFKNDDILHIAILLNAYSEEYLFEKIIEVKEDTNYIDLEITAEEMSKLPIGKLLLEIELTTNDGFVQTHQYDLEIDKDGIYERN